jgi:TfoX/Sxy family transcriptional regulator of competence genes
MAYDAELADRVRELLEPRRDITERKMFGGVAFMVNGNMFVGVSDSDLMVRVGPDAHQASLARPHARPMDFTGRPMKGYVFVGASGYRTRKALETWVERGLGFAATLPKKAKKSARAASR